MCTEITDDLDVTAMIYSQEQALEGLRASLTYQERETASRVERVAEAKAEADPNHFEPRSVGLLAGAQRRIIDEQMHHALSLEAEDSIRVQIHNIEADLVQLRREQRRRDKTRKN